MKFAFWVIWALGTFLGAQEGYGQANAQRITIIGTVYSRTEHTTIPFVNIYDIRNLKGVSSAIDGNFSISVLAGDTIKLTAVGYDDAYIIADTSLQMKPLQVYLDKANYMLNQVTVNPFMNPDAFKKAFLAVPEDSSIRLHMPDVPRERGPVAGSQAAGTLFNFGYDRNQKDIERQDAAIAQWQRDNYYSGKYNRDLIKQVTGIPDEKVDDFVKFCDLKSSFLNTSTEYDLIVAIKDCYKNYQEKHPELKPH